MHEVFVASLKWFRVRERSGRATGRVDTLRRSRFLVSCPTGSSLPECLNAGSMRQFA